ncbi:MAG TPA: hypothetical protein VGA44_06340 [Steroidobacteraceae bacterium]
MRSVFTTVTLLAICTTALTSCSVDQDGDSVSRQFGSDYFGAGGMLNLTAPVEGDALIAGGQVDIASEVKGDLVVAGGELSVGGGVGDDLYAAGGEVRVDAIVAGNARVAGGDVRLGPATVVQGGASLTGGRVDFDGAVQEYLQATGGEVRLNGSVGGDAVVRSGELHIGPDTRIEGRLVYHGPDEPRVPEGATIAGGVEYHESAARRFFDRDTHVAFDSGRKVGSVLWFAGVFAVATLFIVLFPGFSTRAAELIGRDPWTTLGLGLAVLVCVPFVALVLLITIIGIPLALLLVPIYLVLLFLGWVTVALFLGQKGLELARGGRPPTLAWRLLALLAALVTLWLLRQVPYVGPLIGLVALMAGIGALVWQVWARRDRPAPTTA